jgi:hypothetical protein
MVGAPLMRGAGVAIRIRKKFKIFRLCMYTPVVFLTTHTQGITRAYANTEVP